MHTSPLYAPESNRLVERLVREHWSRARVLLMSSDLRQSLWTETLSHPNWLRNRTPSSRLNGNLPIMSCDPNTDIDFRRLHPFGQPGYFLIYYSSTIARKKFLPKSEYSNFIGIASDTRLFRIFVSEFNSHRTVRRDDFLPLNRSSLQSFSSMLDGTSRRREIDKTNETNNSGAEDHLLSAMTAINLSQPISLYGCQKKSREDLTCGPPLPSTSKKAYNHSTWAAASDREDDALLGRGIWELVCRTPNMKPVPFK